MRRTAALRRFYAQLVAATAGVADPRIIEAFATVERERFLGAGPWQVRAAGGYLSTGTDDPAVVYQDILIGLAPDDGINNGEPSLHAKSIAAASPQPGEAIIHVGAGTGYYTRMLAHLVGPGGRVDAFEIQPALAQRAAQNLRDAPIATVHAASAVGRALPAADLIYVSAGVTHIPLEWLDALRPAGRLVVPLAPIQGLGCMLLVTRYDANTYAARAFSPACFVPCTGACDEIESNRLSAAFAARSADEIRSLRRSVPPDDTAWYVGESSWLSTADA